jgi:hypothetical protein
MARNFIQNKADITQYYVNRAKRDDEKSKDCVGSFVF